MTGTGRSGPGARAGQSSAAIAARSASDEAAGWSGWNKATNDQDAVSPGASMTEATTRPPLRLHAGGPARQVGPERKGDLRRIAMGRAEQLERIGRETGRPLGAPLGEPGMPAILCQILSARLSTVPSTACRRRAVVDILRSIGLVVHQEAAWAQSQILRQHRVEGERPAGPVERLDPPAPGRQYRVQLHCDRIGEPVCLAGPFGG